MSRNMPERDPHSEFEDQGIPDLQDGTPGQKWASDPQGAPLPADEPTAVDDYGTTAAEQAEGEPLDLRVDREEPEELAMFGGGAEPRPAGRLVAPDEGAHPQEEPDRIASEVGPDAGGYSPEENAMRVEEDE